MDFPPKKFLCSLLYSQSWIFQDWCLGRALWLKTLQHFVSLLFLRQWQQEMRLAALADSQQEPAAAGTVTLKCWSPPGTQEAAGPSTVTLAQGIPAGKGQPQHKLHFQGCPHGWLHKAQQSLSQKLLKCCILLCNKSSPDCCNYLFTCLLTAVTSPGMFSHLNTAHLSQPSSQQVLQSKLFPKHASEMSPQVPNLW